MNYRLYASSLTSAFDLAESCELTRFAIVKESKKRYQVVTLRSFLSENFEIVYSQNL